MDPLDWFLEGDWPVSREELIAFFSGVELVLDGIQLASRRGLCVFRSVCKVGWAGFMGTVGGVALCAQLCARGSLIGFQKGYLLLLLVLVLVSLRFNPETSHPGDPKPQALLLAPDGPKPTPSQSRAQTNTHAPAESSQIPSGSLSNSDQIPSTTTTIILQ